MYVFNCIQTLCSGAHVNASINIACSGHRLVSSCILRWQHAAYALLPSTGWHRRVCAVSMPWSHQCRGGKIPTQWRKEGTPVPPTDHDPASLTLSFLPAGCSFHKETPLDLGLKTWARSHTTWQRTCCLSTLLLQGRGTPRSRKGQRHIMGLEKTGSDEAHCCSSQVGGSLKRFVEAV